MFSEVAHGALLRCATQRRAAPVRYSAARCSGALLAGALLRCPNIATLQTCDGEDRRVVEGVGKAPVARVVSNRKERCGEKRAGT